MFARLFAIEMPERREDDRQAAFFLLVSILMLFLFWYFGRPPTYRSSGLATWVGQRFADTNVDVEGSGAYVFWGFTSVVFRLLIPFGFAAWFFKIRPADLGLRFRGIARHMPAYIAMYAVMLPLLIWVSSFESFLDYYPFYDRAGEGGAAFWIYQAGYAFQFVGVEAFFRGFMTFGLARYVGWLAVPIMTIPYVMIHFPKPMPEAFGAIIAGLVLGYMALRSKSFVPGIALHVGVAITMDMLVLGRLEQLRNIF